jgi:hypothetical protein
MSMLTPDVDKLGKDVTGWPPCKTRSKSALVKLGDEFVRVIYSDESGLGGFEAEPITVVAAICINVDERWQAVETELADAVYAVPSRKLLVRGSELKGRKLFKCLKKGMPGAAETIAKILSTTVNNKIPIFFAAIDRKGFVGFTKGFSAATDHYTKNKTPQNAAFSQCVERVESFISTFMPKERVLWISDHGGHEPEFKEGLARFKIAEEARVGFSAKENRVAIADTIYFGHSHESLALQLADVCCSTITLRILEEFYGWPRLATPFFDMISSQLTYGDERPMYSGRKIAN